MNSTTINRKVNIDDRMKKTILQGKAFSSPSCLSSTKPKSFNNFNNLKTFKKHSSDLSFEGFSLNGLKAASSTYADETVHKAIDYYSKRFGPAAQDALDQLKKSTIKGVEKQNGSLTFTDDKFIPSLLNATLYPVYNLPKDLINASLKGLSKAPIFKNAKWIETAQNTTFLKNRAEALTLNANKYRVWGHIEKYTKLLVEAEAKAIIKLKNVDDKTAKSILKGLKKEETKDASLKQLNELKKDLDVKTLKKLTKEIFDFEITKSVQNGINPLKGDYNTAAERSLVRFTTGMVTAVYLGNDAYNLTRIVNDDPKQAKREKKSRFLQESSRVVLTAYLIFVALEGLKKYANKSLNFAVGATLGVTALAEIIGRKVARKSVLPMSSETAKKMAHKDTERMEAYDARQEAKAQRKIKSPVSFTKTYQNDIFKDFQPRREAMFEGSKKQPKETKGRFNIWKLAGGLGALILAGFALDKGAKIPVIKNELNKINTNYKKAMKKEVTITKEKFVETLKKLKDENYIELAKFHEKNVLEYNKVDSIDKLSNSVKLGKDYKKGIYPIIDKGLLSPFKFLYNTLITGPYKFITNFFKAAPEKTKNSIDISRNVLKYIDKNKNNPEFKNKFSKKLLDSRDKFNHTNYSSADLGLKTKLYTSLLTGLFLVSDNYNLVMLKTGGKDKALAEQKAQERAVQRLSRTYYSSTIIGIMNKLFEPLYNKSIIGAAAISGLNSVMSDSVTRWSVGLPTGESTRDKIFEIEKENAEATGIKGKFFRSMQYISGKKRLSERTIVKQEA